MLVYELIAESIDGDPDIIYEGRVVEKIIFLAAMGLGAAGIASHLALHPKRVQQVVDQNAAQIQQVAQQPETQQAAERLQQEPEVRQQRRETFDMDQFIEDLIWWENRGRDVGRTMFYDDKGIPTIGVGFNLNRKDARERLADVGADLDSILNGGEITAGQMETLLDSEARYAARAARRVVPGFDDLPDEAQRIFADMAYNMGETGLSGFTKMMAALSDGDFDKAADEMIDSEWYGETGDRARHHVQVIRGLAR